MKSAACQEKKKKKIFLLKRNLWSQTAGSSSLWIFPPSQKGAKCFFVCVSVFTYISTIPYRRGGGLKKPKVLCVPEHSVLIEVGNVLSVPRAHFFSFVTGYERMKEHKWDGEHTRSGGEGSWSRSLLLLGNVRCTSRHLKNILAKLWLFLNFIFNCLHLNLIESQKRKVKSGSGSNRFFF